MPQTTKVENLYLSAEIMDANQLLEYVESTFIHKNNVQELDANIILGKGQSISGDISANTSIAIGGLCQNDNTLAIGYQLNGSEIQRAQALGLNSTALGQTAVAIGKSSVALGSGEARGAYSITLGSGIANGYCSVAQGHGRTYGDNSHAEGQFCEAQANYSHAEGSFSIASGTNSHSEGNHTEAKGSCSHAEGHYTKVNGRCSHAEGAYTTAQGAYSHAEGLNSIAFGDQSKAIGKNTAAYGSTSIALGTDAATRSKSIVNISQLTVQTNDIVKWTDDEGWKLATDAEKASQKCISETSSKTYPTYDLNNWSNTEHEIVRGRPDLEDGHFYKLKSSGKLYTMDIVGGGDQNHNASFVWNGNIYGATLATGMTYYNSHGQGTFNVNPQDGISGFYIGEKSINQCMTECINNTLADKKWSELSGDQTLLLQTLARALGVQMNK